MADKRLFISFAMEDVRYRDLLKGQSLHTRSPYSYVDMSAKRAWDNEWKKNCRSRIRGCNGVIALISKRTPNADGAKWEMQCANDEEIPMIGIHIDKNDKGEIPFQLSGKRVREWTDKAIADFIDGL